MKRLPRSLDDIRGLRVARWIRESTAGQYDRYGPASQREQQDRFIERHGLVDTGLVFQVAHSGTTVWRSATMTEMLAEAQGRGLRPPPGRVLGPLAAQPAPDPRAAGGRPAPGRRGARHVRPADPVLRPARLGRARSPRRPAPRSTAAACPSGSPRATRRSSTSTTTRAAMRPSASGACPSRRTRSRSIPADDRHRGRPVRAVRLGQRQREAARPPRPGSPRPASG